MKSPLIIILFLFSSCAKLSYITEQGLGQVSLEWDGKSNEDVLKDPKVSKEHKQKIKDIQNYKSYFYQYFNKDNTDIYDETTILENEAVTYLVIASPVDKIKAIETSFPIAGSFPYLGFFNKKSALDYSKKMQTEGYSTFMRPVFAYSTLNQWIFDDNILSSFFQYNDRQLAELIFHELTHTILFIKDEVSFNESFAQLIGREMAFEYFQYNKEDIQKLNIVEMKNEKLLSMISKLSQELSTLYKSTQDPSTTLEVFQKKRFEPAIKKVCIVELIKNCWPLKSKWNNAKYAAFGTYQSEQSLIEKIKTNKKLDIKGLFKYIETSYEEYDKENIEKSFVEFLKHKENI